MCNFQELSYNEEGYVIRCKQCGGYQVYFSGIILSFTHREFKQWVEYLVKYPYPVNNVNEPHAKAAFIATPKVGVMLAVSSIEYTQLQKMVQEADNEVQALELLELFQVQ